MHLDLVGGLYYCIVVFVDSGRAHCPVSHHSAILGISKKFEGKYRSVLLDAAISLATDVD